MSDELPRSLKFATIWLVLGAIVFVAFEWRRHEALKASVHGRRRRRRDPPRRRRPLPLAGNAQRHAASTSWSTPAPAASRSRRRSPTQLGLVAEGTVRSSTAAGWTTGRVVRADLTLDGGVAPSGCAWSRCRISPARCSAWTSSGGCAGSSATARCGSTSARATRQGGAVTAVRQLLLAARARVADHPLAALLVATLTLGGVTPAAGAEADVPTACPPAAAPLSSQRFEAGLREASDHGFLWRLSKDGRTSYLYGTIHVAQPRVDVPGPARAAALAASDVARARARRARHRHPARASPPARAPRRATPAAARRCSSASTAGWWPSASTRRRRTRSRRVADRLALGAGGTARAASIRPTASTSCWPLIARQIGKPIVSLETPEAQVAALRMPIARGDRSSWSSAASTSSRPVAPARSLARLARAWTAATWPSSRTTARWCECLRNDAERRGDEAGRRSQSACMAAAIEALHAARPARVRRRRQPAHDRAERPAGAARAGAASRSSGCRCAR